LVYYKKKNEESGSPFTDVGIEENFSNFIKIYPNPASNEIKLILNQVIPSEQFQIEVYNMMGSLVHSEQVLHISSNSALTIKVADLSNGSYFIHCSTSSYSWKGRFEVIR